MPHRLKSRLAKSWLVAACLAVGLIAPSGASAEPSSTACNARANDTPNKLLPCIKTADLWDAHAGVPERSPTRTLARTAIRRATRASRATWRRPLREGQDGGRRLRRHAPEVQVHLHVIRRHAVVERGVADCAELHGRSPTGTRGRATATATGATVQTVRRHRDPADPEPELGERLQRGRLQRVHARQHRPDPARHLQLRREGPERHGGGRIGRRHLQRGPARPRPACSAAAWWTPTTTRSWRRSPSRSRRSPPA